MIYSRHDLINLVRQQPAHLQSILLALMWHTSQANPNFIDSSGGIQRYGLCGVSIDQAKRIGFSGSFLELLNPELNIQLAAKLLAAHGLVEYAGRELSSLLVPILQLAENIELNNKKTPVVNH